MVFYNHIIYAHKEKFLLFDAYALIANVPYGKLCKSRLLLPSKGWPWNQSIKFRSFKKPYIKNQFSSDSFIVHRGILTNKLNNKAKSK